ncbi:MAG: CocE/NonD family hydrolase [Thermomicrobiales bacterium]
MEPVGQVIIEKDVPATMRDGTILQADVYRPAVAEPLPALLTRTPYGKDFPVSTTYVDVIRLARRGYVVIIQDARGCYASAGAFVPFEAEFEDGFDTVEWAARLPWCNGQVGMWGASYFGMTQWQAAVMQPPVLRSIVPSITWGNYLNGIQWRGGARELGLTVSWTQTAVAPAQLLRQYAGDHARIGRELPQLVGIIDRLPEVYTTLPLDALPDPSGVAHYMFASMGRSLTDEAYWARMNLDGRYDQIQTPTLHIGGWYDCFLGETLRQYQAMRAVAEPGAIGPRLVIGPWTHGRFDAQVGDLNFGLASSGIMLNYRGDLTEWHLRWYDATLRGKPEALAGQSPVEVFVQGENRWRGYGAWPPPGAHDEVWYCHSSGEAATRAGDGRLSREQPGDEPHDAYLADPRDPVPTRGGNILMSAQYRSGPLDQGPNEDRPDVLCYTSDALSAAYTVLGPVSVTLFAASSAPDTDWVARLVDVYPDGRAMLVADGIVRGSRRESYPAPGVIRPVPPCPIEPGRVYEYAIDLWAAGLTFLAGHRLRVEIASSCFPRWDRNLQTGQDGMTSAETAVARQQVFHDAARPSRITLSVVAD